MAKIRKNKNRINESTTTSDADMKQKGYDAFWDTIDKIKNGQYNPGQNQGGQGNQSGQGSQSSGNQQGQGGQGQQIPNLPIPPGVPRPLSDEAKGMGCDSSVPDGVVYRNSNGDNIMNINSGDNNSAPMLGRDVVSGEEMEALAKQNGMSGVSCSQNDAKKTMDEIRRKFEKEMRRRQIKTKPDKENNGGKGTSTSLWDCVMDMMAKDEPLVPWQDTLRDFMNMPEPEQQWKKSTPRVAWGAIDKDLDPMQHMEAVKREVLSKEDSMITDVFYLIDASGSMNLTAIADGLMGEILGIEDVCGVMKSGLAYYCDGLSKQQGCIRTWEREDPDEEIDKDAIIKYIKPKSGVDYLDGGTDLEKAVDDLITYGRDYFDVDQTRLIIITDADCGTELSAEHIKKLMATVDKVFFLVVNNRSQLPSYMRRIKDNTHLTDENIGGIPWEDLQNGKK